MIQYNYNMNTVKEGQKFVTQFSNHLSCLCSLLLSTCYLSIRKCLDTTTLQVKCFLQGLVDDQGHVFLGHIWDIRKSEYLKILNIVILHLKALIHLLNGHLDSFHYHATDTTYSVYFTFFSVFLFSNTQQLSQSAASL